VTGATSGSGMARGVGLAILVSYAAAVAGFLVIGPPLLHASSVPDPGDATGGRRFAMALALFCVAAAAIAVLHVGHIVHAARNRRLSADARALWIAALVVGSVVVLPFYWYAQVWRPVRDAAPEAAAAEAGIRQGSTH